MNLPVFIGAKTVTFMILKPPFLKISSTRIFSATKKQKTIFTYISQLNALQNIFK